MTKLVNRAKMTTATTGTGTITLGSAVDGYQTFAAAGVANGNIVRYVIEDGNNWEIGLGTYSSTGNTLTRGTIESSTGAAINLSGNATVFCTIAAADLQELIDFADTFTLPTADGTNGQVLTTNGSGTLTFTTIAGYSNADVDAHLNTGTAASGEVLSWNGADYDWVTAPAALTGQTNSASPFETSLGSGAGAVNTGANNTFIGFEAGNDNTTGTDNVAVGYQSFSTSTSGSGNTVIGAGASSTPGTATFAVAVGRLAVSAASSVSVGYAAGLGGSGSQSVAVGAEAGRNNKALGNIGIGWRAGRGNTTGGLTGSNNVSIGRTAGQDLSTGEGNFLGGQNSGLSLTTGSNNVAIGNGALDAATTGGRNIAIGQDAMGAGVATAASGNNVAVGSSAGFDITTGVDNIMLGRNSGPNVTTGARNIYVGPLAGDMATTGSDNIVIGSGAFDVATTGGRNIVIGTEAMGLSDVTDATGDNIAIGYRAGYRVTSGTDNVFIGEQAGEPTTTGSNQIVIGRTAQASSATVSNEITLGNSSITRFRVPGAGIDNTSAALSGTTPSVNVGARDTYTLTTSGNTTFTFTGAPSSGQVGTFSLIITAGGTHTLTWPASVDWAGGTAPDAPASGETDVYTFMTIDGGTRWFGFLAGDAMA